MIKLEMKKNKINILFLVTLVVVCIIITTIASKKEGFHADEIFSYGSSNYKSDNLFQPYGTKDTLNLFVERQLKEGNIFSKLLYYLKNQEEFWKDYKKIEDSQIPVWKTAQQAHEYVTIQKEDILNYAMVYYNQARDCHPPLFYLLVHTVSILFFNRFSLFIILIINLTFFVLTCIVLKKIFRLLQKEKWAILAVVLYGLSMGGIETIIFQRMYTMLTFFCVAFLYFLLKYYKSGYTLKEVKPYLGMITLLGFLTHYYFCLYAIFVLAVVIVDMVKRHVKIKELLCYFAKVASIGVLLFLPCIYHIFFSYRGIGNGSDLSYFESLLGYMKLIFNAFSIPIFLGYLLLIVGGCFSIYQIVKNGKKEVAEIIVFPVLAYILIVSKSAPFLEIRYVMCILPIIVIGICLLLEHLLNKITLKVNTRKIVIGISVILVMIPNGYGLIYKKPQFLYEGYQQYLEIAKENKDIHYIYITDTTFNSIADIQEFQIYDKTMMLNVNKGELKYIVNNEILSSNEFILSIKDYLDTDKIIEEVLNLTGYQEVEVLIDSRNTTQSGMNAMIYRVSKNN